MFAIMHGNPVDGLQFVGPFTTNEAAIAWAGREPYLDWWVVELKRSGDTLDYEGGEIPDPQ